VGPRAGLDTEARGKILSPLPGIKPQSPGHPVHSQDTILTELPWLAPLNPPRLIFVCFWLHYISRSQLWNTFLSDLVSQSVKNEHMKSWR
jgi:hypothetical protein